LRVKNSWTTSLTKTGRVRVKTRTKVPMMPAFTTSTTFRVQPPTTKGRKKKSR